MIGSEARTEKTATPIAPIIPDESDKMLAFSEILRKTEQTDERSIVPLLKKIEFNTSLLKKLSNATPTPHERAVIAKGVLPPSTLPPRRDEKPHATTEERALSGAAKKTPNPLRSAPAVVARRVKEEVAAQGAPAEEARAAVAGLQKKESGELQATASVDTGGATMGTAAKTAPIVQSEAFPAEQKAKPARKDDTPRLAPATASKSGRDKGGRFVGKSKSQEAKADQGDRMERKSVLQTLKRGFEGMGAKGKGAMASNAGTMEEAAGRAAGGPMFEAAMEIKGAVDSARDEDSIIGKAARKIREKTGLAKSKDQEATPRRDEKPHVTTEAKAEDARKIVDSLQSSEKEDEKRHAELIKAILKSDKEGKSGVGKESNGDSLGLPSLKKTGPGAAAREKLKKSMQKSQLPAGVATKSSKFPGMQGGGPLGGGAMQVGGAMLGKLGKMAMTVGPVLAALPLATIAVGIAAAGAVGAAGYSAITGKDNFINELFKKLTGLDAGKPTKGDEDKVNKDVLANTQRVNAERRAQGKKELEFDPTTGMVKPGAVATASESGKGGAGTISTGKNDAGGASYGKKQFASAGGDKSQVAQFVKQSSHAKEFDGLKPGTPAFDQKWKEVAAADKNFGAEQDAHVAKTMSAPVIATAVNKGFNTKDVGIREALISQSVNHGPGGNKRILEGAQAELAKKYGTAEAAPAQDQIDALTASRKSYVNQVAEGKTVTAQKLRAKGDEKGAIKAEGEAKQLKSMAGAGGRYDQENAITKELSATGGIAGKTVTAQKAKPVEPIVQGEATRAKASAAALPSPSIEVATDVPVADARRSSITKATNAQVAEGKTVPAQKLSGDTVSPGNSRQKQPSVQATAVPALAPGAKAGMADVVASAAAKEATVISPSLPAAATEAKKVNIEQGRRNLLEKRRATLAIKKVGGEPPIAGQATVAEGESVRDKATTIAKTTDPAAVATTTVTPAADGRGRKLSGIAERAAKGADSLAATSVNGVMPAIGVLAGARQKAIPSLAAPGAQPLPVASLATSVTSRPSPPERIQPTANEIQGKVTQGTAGGSIGAGGEGAASMPGMDKLMAMMTKLLGGKENGGAGQQQIRTEFDDTMLTLMAYDRV